jgi:lysyl-tRNA synthetase class 2
MKEDWKPSATFKTLQYRANLLETIRSFFKDRQVLEVETPLLSTHSVTDPHLDSFCTQYRDSSGKLKQPLYLQTSPEFAMKRLLAAGSGPIFQITHAFRNRGEQGRWHNPEFTLLEWYRPGFSLFDLMNEVEELLTLLLGCPAAHRISYEELFKKHLAIDPHRASLSEIHTTLKKCNISLHSTHTVNQIDEGLQLLLDFIIQNRIEPSLPVFIYDFPSSQAALAKIRPGPIPVAERVEVYIGGLELANGFHELADPTEQARRFYQDLMTRQNCDLPAIPIDTHLLAALHHGLPDCSGIALGIDRLVAHSIKAQELAEVLTFPLDSA